MPGGRSTGSGNAALPLVVPPVFCGEVTGDASSAPGRYSPIQSAAVGDGMRLHAMLIVLPRGLSMEPAVRLGMPGSTEKRLLMARRLLGLAVSKRRSS